jgi:hypothetical protein
VRDDGGLERQLWSWMEKGLRPFGQHAHVTRIENSASSGFPDVEGCIDGRAFVTELKVMRGSHLKITDKQCYFAFERWRAGGISWVLIRGSGPQLGPSGHAHYLVPGSRGLDLLEDRGCMLQSTLASYSCCPPDLDSHRLWNEIIRRP